MFSHLFKFTPALIIGIISLIFASIFTVAWAVSSSYQASFSLTDGGLTANITSPSDWTAGYCRNMDILNTGTNTLSWSLAFDLDAPTTSAWNGIFVQSGIRYSITPESWNQSISPGAKISLGFCADTVNRDSNWILSSKIVANLPVTNGNCGSDNSKTLSVTPTNLCTLGAPSNIVGQGPWDWTCQGQNNGTTATCHAKKGTIATTSSNTSSTTTAPGIFIFTVDASKNRTPISPYIYGRNF